MASSTSADPELGVDPEVRLAVAAAAAPGELGDEAVAPGAEDPAALEGRHRRPAPRARLTATAGAGGGAAIGWTATSPGSPNRFICGTTSAATGTKSSSGSERSVTTLLVGLVPALLVLAAAAPHHPVDLVLDLGRVASAAPARRGGRASSGRRCRSPPDEPADDLAEDHRRLRRGRVDADPQPRDVDALGDHVDRDDPAARPGGELAEAAVGAGVLVEHDGRRLAGDVGQRRRHDAGVSAVGGDDEARRRRDGRRPGPRVSCSSAWRRIRGSPSGSSVEIAVR